LIDGFPGLDRRCRATTDTRHRQFDSDLRSYAAGVAPDVTGPQGLAVLRLVISLSGGGTAGTEARNRFLAERGRQLAEMLDRARSRGENPPEALDVLDHILAPLYIRSLFGMGGLTPDYLGQLVDRILATTRRVT
jgi:hypothetical protein